MSSLKHCLTKIGLQKHEAAILRGAAAELTAEGYAAHEAAVTAVKDYISELEGERASIVKQVQEQAAKQAADMRAQVDAAQAREAGEQRARDEGRWQELMRGSKADVQTIVGRMTKAEAQAALDRLDAAPGDNATVRAALQAKLAPAQAEGVNLDVGENLYANRRNFVAGKGVSWNDIANLNDALKKREATKAKAWPKPDYGKLVDEGMPRLIARIIKHVYDSIATAPSKADDASLKAYFDAVERVRDSMFTWASDATAVNRFLAAARAAAEKAKGSSFLVGGLGEEKYAVLRAIWPDANGRNGFQSINGDTQAAADIRALGGRKPLAAMQIALDDLLGFTKDISEKGWPASQEQWQRQGFKILDKAIGRVVKGRRGTGANAKELFRVMLGQGWLSPTLEAHDTEAAAQAQLDALKPFVLADKRGRVLGSYATNDAAVEAAREATKRETKGGDVRGTMIGAEQPREGPARRAEGENVTSQRLMDELGFRGVNFGRIGWMTPAERQVALNSAYDSLLDLAELLGVPPKALSLNGMLGIAFGAQGRGGHAAAHFVPGHNEINLTRTAGAGTLAHEWGHALDHYFATLGGLAREENPYMSAQVKLGGDIVRRDADGLMRKGQRFGPGIRQEIVGAFNEIVQAMERRPLSEAEIADMKRERVAKAKRQLDSWIQHFRAGLKNADEKVLADFDAQAERMRNGQPGDPVRMRGSVMSDAVMRMRVLIQSHAKSSGLDMASNWKGLSSNVDHVAYLLAEREASKTHVPQSGKTDYAKESAAKESSKGKKYWSTEWEMFARAFELWVSDKLAARAQANLFLSDADKRQKATGPKGELLLPYPRGEEQQAIGKAFDALVGAIRTRETDKGVALESRRRDADQYGLGRFGIRSTHEVREGYRDSSDWREVPAAMRDVDAVGAISEELADILESAVQRAGIRAGEAQLDATLDENGNISIFRFVDGPQGRVAIRRIVALADKHGLGVLVRRSADKADSAQTFTDLGFEPYITRAEAATRNKSEAHNSVRWARNIAGAPLYSRQAGAGGLTVDRVRQIVADKLGAEAVAALERAGILDIRATNDTGIGSEQTDGLYYSGTAYLFADRLTEGSVLPVLMEELGEHYGLPAALGAEAYRKLTGRVAQLQRDGYAPAANAWAEVKEAYADRFGGMSDSELAANAAFMHEVIAKMGRDEAVQARPWWRELLAKIKAFLLREFGITAGIDEKDVGSFIEGAARRAAKAAGLPAAHAGAIGAAPQPGFDITPELRAQAMRGLPLFSIINDAVAFARKVDDFLRGLISERFVRVTSTPAVLRALGYADRSVEVSPRILQKALREEGADGGKHGLPVAAVKAIARGLHDPVAVFQSEREADTVMLALEQEVGGLPIVVGVRKADNRVTINSISTIYDGKLTKLERWTDDGLLRYMHTQKRPAWLTGRGAQLHKALSAKQGADRNVLTELDVVNRSQQPLESRIRKSRQVEPDFAAGMTPAQKETLRKVGLVHEEPTLAGRAAALLDSFRKEFVQGVFDQYAPLKDLSMRIYKLARMSSSSDGSVEALLFFGKPFMTPEGGVDVKVAEDGKGGFLHVLQDLNGEHDRFFAWVAGNRAALLKQQGRENLLTDNDITFLKDLNAGKMKDGRDRQEVYAEAQARLREFNNAALDIAEKSGLFDAESRALWAQEFYVPFYRVLAEGIGGPSIKSGLVNQYGIKKLKGGTAELNDLLKNTLMNWAHLASAAAKNRAAKEAAEELLRLGGAIEADEATIRSMGKAAGEKAVSFLDNGVRRWMLIDDHNVYDALAALNWGGFGPVMKPMQTLKRWLTFGVTINPTFKAANLIRDTLSAVGTAPVSYNPLKNLVEGWQATARHGQTYASMLAGGGMFRFGTSLEGDRAQHLKRLAELGMKDFQLLDSAEKLKALGTKLWDLYQDIGDRSENVNRAAIYQQLRAKGLSHLDASFAARDLMDFGLQGKWALIRFLVQVVPFMNARLQGLYKLGRASQEDKARFGAVVAAVSAASIALMLMNQDDDEWRRQEDWQRDTYWWVRIGGHVVLIPKPFEIGALGTLAERSLELLIDKDMTAKRYMQRLADMFANTFAMSPVPQAVKPILDVYANRDSFTRRPIESLGMERLRPQDRYTGTTSELAKLIGSLGLPQPSELLQGQYEPISPVQADHLMRGYFAALAVGLNMMVDAIFRPIMDRPERATRGIADTPLVGRFVRELPTGQSRYVTEFYDASRQVEQAYATYRDALKRGDKEAAAEIRADVGDAELRKGAAAQRYRNAMAAYNLQRRRIEADKELNAREKRERLLDIRDRQEKLARQFIERTAATP